MLALDEKYEIFIIEKKIYIYFIFIFSFEKE
jgi:hypothetical protein